MKVASPFLSNAVRCPSCGLCQFKTVGRTCPRCNRPLILRFTGPPTTYVPQEAYEVSALGLLIRKMRRERKLSQTGLAKKMGTSRAQVSKIETGLVVPTIRTLSRFAVVFGIDIVEIFLQLRRQQPALNNQPCSVGRSARSLALCRSHSLPE